MNRKIKILDRKRLICLVRLQNTIRRPIVHDSNYPQLVIYLVIDVKQTNLTSAAVMQMLNNTTVTAVNNTTACICEKTL